MCHLCELADVVGYSATRRRFLHVAGGIALGAVLNANALAADDDMKKKPPKPQNVISPDAALERLMEGNARYVKGVSRRHDFTHEREALEQGQNPFAAILSCADSRIEPEYAFDTARGDLFVCRIAGNFASDEMVASLEYAVAVLNAPLIMVLGHGACGAVDATIKSLKDNTTLPGHLPSLVTALTPAVKASSDKPGDLLDNAIKQNVVLNIDKLAKATPILSQATSEKKIRVVGGVYNLRTGHVDLVS